MIKKNCLFKLGSVLMMLCLFACRGAPPEPTPETVVREVDAVENPVPGTVNDVWVEPMYDVVEMPGQIDPTNTYYRARHQTIVEIRPGRYQKLEYPDDVPAKNLRTR